MTLHREKRDNGLTILSWNVDTPKKKELRKVAIPYTFHEYQEWPLRTKLKNLVFLEISKLASSRKKDKSFLV
jgi:hypothetical protein